MGNWDFDDIGGFGSERAALEWARRNNIDPRDIHIRKSGDSVEASLRRSANTGRSFDDKGDRRDGY